MTDEEDIDDLDHTTLDGMEDLDEAPDHSVPPTSPDLISENAARLAEIFPEAVTEDGIDFEVFKEILGEDLVEGEERYGLDWAGKAQARRIAAQPSAGTLRPSAEDSVEWDTTGNLVIEGDNLEVLKLLQKSYAGKVKLIYIDPPYNIDADSAYEDRYVDSLGGYLREMGLIEDDEINTTDLPEKSGRFHTRWLSLMLPRLIMARELLTEDGILAISIDDWEQPRLSHLVSEVFGETNLINTVAVKSSEASGVKMSHVEKKLPKLKEYLFLVAKNREKLTLRPLAIEKSGEKLDKYLSYYRNVIVNPESPPSEWKIVSISDYLNDRDEETTDEALREFKLAEAKRVVYRTNNKLLASMSFETETEEVISPDGMRYIWWEGKQMLFLSENLEEALCDLWTDVSTINLNVEACGVKGFGAGQKPIELVQRVIQLGNASDSSDGLVMDFFAGSGTTGHAVMAQNAEDGGNRRFILVQLPEPLDPEVKEQKVAAEFCDELEKPRNIAELTKERLRRAAAKVKEENPDFDGDIGFRVLKLDSSNVVAWDPETKDLEGSLEEQVNPIKEDRTELDLLFEGLLKLGIDPTAPIEEREVEGARVMSVGEGRLMACLAESLDREAAARVADGIIAWVNELGTADDVTCLFRDSSFVGDAAKAELIARLTQAEMAENLRFF